MDISSPVFIILALTGAILTATGLFLRSNPPAHINGSYGYRTPRSMKSQENWDFAQAYASRQLLIAGLLLVVLSIPGSMLDVTKTVAGLTSTAMVILASIIPIFTTERALIRRKERL